MLTIRFRSSYCLSAAATLAMSACHRVPHEAPPRATDTIAAQPQSSVIAVPVSADLGALTAVLQDAVPQQLWTIDKPNQTCAAAARIKIAFAKIKTPEIKCRIVGTVTRGPVAVSGAERDILVTMPLHATVSARDIGGVLKQETAQADALVRARIRIDVARDWSLNGKVAISYDWADAPHVDVLGQRIEFTSKADAKLAGVIDHLQRTLPGELAKLHFRDRVGDAWKSAFTSIQLNESDPPVWMRIEPRELSYGGYRIAGHRLTLNLGMTAVTETFVGPRPQDAPATTLPPLRTGAMPAGGIVFAIPVIADYHELEPVLAKALAKREQRPFDVPGLGPIEAHFGRIIVYGTTGGKIAVGLAFSASKPGSTASHGTVWLTARPTNAINSRQVAFADLSVFGVTDSIGTGLLLKLANAPGLSSTIAGSLTQNFAKDYDNLLGKIGRAISEKRQGDLLIRAHVGKVRTGEIRATGQGLYLPVWGKGIASIELAPR